MNDIKYKRLVELAQIEYQDMNICSHDWDHIQRVLQYCKHINKGEKADESILFPACILHDLGRAEGEDKQHFHSLDISRKLLAQSGYSNSEQEKIILCIQSHSVYSNVEPGTMEAKILFDADKLDSYGAIGVTRFFTLAGEQNWSLQESSMHAFDRIMKLNDIGGFYTKEAEQIGLNKARVTCMFYYSLFMEMDDTDKMKLLERILLEKYGSSKARKLLQNLKSLFD